MADIAEIRALLIPLQAVPGQLTTVQTELQSFRDQVTAVQSKFSDRENMFQALSARLSTLERGASSTASTIAPSGRNTPMVFDGESPPRPAPPAAKRIRSADGPRSAAAPRAVGNLTQNEVGRNHVAFLAGFDFEMDSKDLVFAASEALKSIVPVDLLEKCEFKAPRIGKKVEVHFPSPDDCKMAVEVAQLSDISFEGNQLVLKFERPYAVRRRGYILSKLWKSFNAAYPTFKILSTNLNLGLLYAKHERRYYRIFRVEVESDGNFGLSLIDGDQLPGVDAERLRKIMSAVEVQMAEDTAPRFR